MLVSPSNKIVVIGKSVIVVNRIVMESSLEIRDDLIHFSFREKPHYAALFLVMITSFLVNFYLVEYCKEFVFRPRKECGKTHILSYRKPTLVGWSRRLR